MTRTVVRHAPGKLFVAGEYAVLEPGSSAVLAAVDRQVTVTVTAASAGDGLTIVSDLMNRPMPHVVAAVEIVSELLAEWDLTMPPVQLSIHSGLHERGVKFGLGSSGAVTVATIDALLAYCHVSLCTEERFRLALLASIRLDARASGGDLALSTWGGWIVYSAPDRAAVADLAQRKGLRHALQAPWPGFSVRPLPPPRGLAVQVGWTGNPASTSDKVASGTVRNWRGSPAHREFVRRSNGCVTALVDALERGDDTSVLDAIRRARRLLAGADSHGDLGIFTDGLTAMCDAAEDAGGAAKPSGAGGGDCGIALLEPGQLVIDRMRARWLTAGVVQLPIQVSEPAREMQTSDL
ncbi:phosphomevalonate kinase [Lentzea sp. NPDC051213]|uniref:phosphomevalonate kinase n=1 Tax=Lentzea sp. NPDC051213 TaxID=3364126 RepID=UPI0037B567F7